MAFASRLPNGDTLLTDAGNSRAVEVNANDQVVWQYFTDTSPLSIPAPVPTRAMRLKNGDTLISDQFNNRVIQVNKAKRHCRQIMACRWMTEITVGYDLNTTQKGQYAPYDAKVIGDYTGLTPPFDFDGDADDGVERSFRS